MARRYYRRYRRYRRTYYRRKKWTGYTTEVATGNLGGALNAASYAEQTTVCVYGSSNSLTTAAAAATPVSAINYYVTRCRFKGVLTGKNTENVSYIFYIAYVPNAVDVDNNVHLLTGLADSFFYKHPEYVLSWTRMDYINNTGDTGEVSLYSRVTKRLSPGDRLVVGQLCMNSKVNEAQSTYPIQGTFSCYLRTN